MTKIFWMDTETTGLNAVKNDIIQLAYIIDIDGEIKLEKSIKFQPFNYATIETSALDVNHTTIEDLKSYQFPKQAFNILLNDLSKFINKFDKKDKFIIGGYNVNFDMNFLQNYFKKNNDKWFGCWFNYYKIDPLQLLYILDYKDIIKLPNYKLTSIAEYLNIELDAHDALNDIRVTREVFYKLIKYVKE